MKWWVSLCILLATWSQAYAGETSVLSNVQVVESLDSVQLQLNFSGDLPEKYRVVAVKDSTGATSLLLAFLGVGFDTTGFTKDHPKWLSAESVKEQGDNIVRLHVLLSRDVAYRGEWKEKGFHLVLPNAMDRSVSMWKKPWIYVGLGAATVGGAVLWMTVGSSTNSNQDVPSPDIKLPK